MKKMLTAFAAVAMAAFMNVNVALANPTCVMLKFEDDTRFDRLETTGTLSDLILEKLINTGKFNFVETKPLPESLEKRLYNEKANEIENLQWSLYYGNYSRLFEGPGFDEKRAQSIATAQLGQIISPDITSYIGRQHKAEYLIQGTIINVGEGAFLYDKAQQIANGAVSAINAFGSTNAANFLGPLGFIASAISINKGQIGIQADVRVIKASTGEVVWQKRITGKDTTTQVGVAFIKVGSTKLNSNMYFKAVDVTSTLIAKELAADMDAGKLFVK